jgi:DNA-binding CsgD family transcriptional regulator
MSYPTKGQRDLLLDLVQKGPRALAPLPGRGTTAAWSRRFETLRDLFTNLGREDLVPHVADIVRDDVMKLNESVITAAYAEARLRGLVFRDCQPGQVGPGVTGDLPPWTARQAYVAQLTALGLTYRQIAVLLKMTEVTVAAHMLAARRMCGAANNPQLIANAYRLEWLPAQREAEELCALNGVRGL